MYKEWRYFLLALGFFTRIPVPSFSDFQESDLNHSAKYFPLVGIIVGVVGAVFFVLSVQFLPQTIAVLISMAATIYLTGAFHEDGLADSADGLGGGWQREQILTIMQDSRIGTYGAVALFLMLFAKFQTLANLSPAFVPAALVLAHAFSRLSAVWLMKVAQYVRVEGKSKPLATQIKNRDFLLANLFGLLPFAALLVLLVANQHGAIVLMKFVLMTFVPVVLVWLWWRAKLLKRIGGYTGDTLGAMQQISELAFYLGFLMWNLQV